MTKLEKVNELLQILRVLCGNNIFTTGFDHPPVDLIGMLRPTISPGLWVQMLGRGTSLSDGSIIVIDLSKEDIQND